ncbi:MAG TPA: nitronate monooxygenase [Thermoleophilaceae bacterium]|nr:nitronate monooxygenase [Thermoleophilaceae bacterium]
MLKQTALTELLGIELPVIQAPMAGAATPELAAAVCGAGGLGSLGSAALPPDELVGQAQAVRELTDRPFNVNFFCHRRPELEGQDAMRARERFGPLYGELGLGEPPDVAVPPIAFDEERLAALLEIRPAVASFHFGVPDDVALNAVHDAGCRVLSSATTVAEAEHLAGRGVDAVIAQGAEAGGHRGSFLVEGDDGPVGTLALVPQVVDAVDIPVIAAGGIGDGRGLAAVLALGAAGAQIGTAFLACPEVAIHPVYRAALRAARAEATTITRAFSGRPARALRNRAIEEAGDEALAYPAQLSLSVPLGAAAAERGSGDFLAMWAGQAAPLADEMPAAELVARIVSQAQDVLAELSG